MWAADIGVTKLIYDTLRRQTVFQLRLIKSNMLAQLRDLLLMLSLTLQSLATVEPASGATGSFIHLRLHPPLLLIIKLKLLSMPRVRLRGQDFARDLLRRWWHVL